MTLGFLPLFGHPNEEISPDKGWSGESIHAVCATFFPPLTADDAPPERFTHGCLRCFQCWDMP